MALHLMGVEVRWNARNQPDELRLVADAAMTHPPCGRRLQHLGHLP
jgi:hypothetical protein